MGMLQLAWFFRQTPDAHTMESHMVMCVVASFFFTLGVLWYVRYAPKWRLRWERRLAWPLYMLTFFSFIGLMAWRGYHMGIFQALPLTWIGLGQFLMLVTLVYPSRLLQEVAAVIGLCASVLMFVTPVPSEFVWPHIFLVLYFMSAFAGGWLATILALSAENEWTNKSVFMTAFFMTGYESVRMMVIPFSPIDVQLLYRLPLISDMVTPAIYGFITVIHLLLSLMVVTAVGFFLICIRRYTDAASSECIGE